MYTQGYILLTLGKRYIDESIYLINTIRKQGDLRPISLIIFKEDEEYCKSKNLFDQYIYFDTSEDNEIWLECKTTFEKYCLYPRLKLNTYLIYDETIILDTDVLCQSSPEPIWIHLSNNIYNNNLITIGNINNPKWHWGYIGEVSEYMNKTVPETHGGFFYINKKANLKEYFDYCKYVFLNYDKFKCKSLFRNGKVDEIIFAIANAHFNISPIEFSEFPIMTFNYTPDMIIPSKLQTEGGNSIELNDYIPFIHMFDKLEGINFQDLYRRIMENN